MARGGEEKKNQKRQFAHVRKGDLGCWQRTYPRSVEKGKAKERLAAAKFKIVSAQRSEKKETIYWRFTSQQGKKAGDELAGLVERAKFRESAQHTRPKSAGAPRKQGPADDRGRCGSLETGKKKKKGRREIVKIVITWPMFRARVDQG